MVNGSLILKSAWKRQHDSVSFIYRSKSWRYHADALYGATENARPGKCRTK